MNSWYEFLSDVNLQAFFCVYRIAYLVEAMRETSKNTNSQIAYHLMIVDEKS